MGGGGAAHYLATGQTTGGAFGLYRWDMGPRAVGAVTALPPQHHRVVLRAERHGPAARRAAAGATPARATSSTCRSAACTASGTSRGSPASMLLLLHARCAAARTTSRRSPTRARREAMGEDDWTASSSATTRSGSTALVQRDRPRVVRLAGAGLRVDRGAGGLARRAPPGHPLLGAAGPARRAGSRCRSGRHGLPRRPNDPVVAAAPRVAGGVLLGVVQVGHASGRGRARPAPRGRGRRRPGSTGARRG